MCVPDILRCKPPRVRLGVRSVAAAETSTQSRSAGLLPRPWNRPTCAQAGTSTLVLAVPRNPDLAVGGKLYLYSWNPPLRGPEGSLNINPKGPRQHRAMIRITRSTGRVLVANSMSTRIQARVKPELMPPASKRMRQWVGVNGFAVQPRCLPIRFSGSSPSDLLAQRRLYRLPMA